MDIKILTASFEFQLLYTVITIGVAIAAVALALSSIRSEVTKGLKIVTLVTALSFWTAASMVGIKMMKKVSKVPALLSATPKNKTVLNRKTNEFRIMFGSPVLYTSLSIHTYPEIEMTVTPKKYLFGILPFGSEISISPKMTFPPNENLMLYMSNIEGPFTHGYGGEQLLEFSTDDISITKANIADSAKDVPPSQSFQFDISGTYADEAEWSVKLEPPTTELGLKKN